jgi:predicted HD superfamily hydrolase involved in NAD metabolism
MDFISKLELTEDQKEHLKAIDRKIKEVMPEKLYRHSVNTLEYAGEISKRFMPDIDLYRLSVACILHDYGKIFSYEELARIVKENKLEIRDFELNTPPLLHSFVGDYLVSRDFGINDDKILKSIRFHTTGYCNMSLEDKILFISDKLERSRDYEGVENLRNIASENINLCLLEVYKNIIIYIVRGNKLLHPDSARIWNNICGGI